MLIPHANAPLTEVFETGTGWEPSDATISKFAWYDFSDTLSVTTTGTTIDSVTDQFSNYNLTGLTGDEPELLSNQINGLHAASFTADNQLYNSTVSLTSVGLMILGVFVVESASDGNARIVSFRDGVSAADWGSTDHCMVGRKLTQSNVILRRNADSTLLGFTYGSAFIASVGSTTAENYVSLSSVSGTGELDNPETGPSQGATLAYDATYLALGEGGSGEGLTGLIGEIVIFDEFDLTTRRKTEGYLAHKWGLSGDLPSGHPYKSAAP